MTRVQLSCHHFWFKLTLTIPRKHIDANVYPVINIKTFLPVIALAVLRINKIDQNIVLKKQLKCYTQFSGSSSAKKFGVEVKHLLQ